MPRPDDPAAEQNETRAYREEEMLRYLNVEQLKHYRGMPPEKQLHVAHYVLSGHAFHKALELANGPERS